jgi:hypothetical protein
MVVVRAEADAAAVAALAHSAPDAQFITLDIAAARRVVLGDGVNVIAIWSQAAAADGMAAYLAANTASFRGRLAVALADDTPLPRLQGGPGRATVLDLVRTTEADFLTAWSEFTGARKSAPVARMHVATRRSVAIGEFAPGVSLGVAIFAGMFAAATAASQEDIAIAVETGSAPTVVANALRPFLNDTMQSASIEIERADVFAPRASFAEVQRLAITETQASDVLPIVADIAAGTQFIEAETAVSQPAQSVTIESFEPVAQPVEPLVFSSVEAPYLVDTGLGLVPIDAPIDFAPNPTSF